MGFLCVRPLAKLRGRQAVRRGARVQGGAFLQARGAALDPGALALW
jgi:hypothetical protein